MLDSATLFIASIAIEFGLAVYFWSLWIGDRQQRINFWIAASSSCGTVGLLMITLRGSVPEWLAIWGSVLGFIQSHAFLWAAVRLVNGNPQPKASLWAGGVLWTLFCLVPPFFAWEILRSTCSTIIYTAFCLAMCRDMVRAGIRRQRLSRMLTAALLFIRAVATVGLTIYTALNQETFSPVQQSQPLAALWLLLFLVIYIVLVVSVTTLELGNEAERQRQMASTDMLTGLMNRRAFMEEAQRQAERREEIALLLLDIDHFKRINDRWGHAAGDQALVRFAEALGFATNHASFEGAQARPLIARLGGEEFVCLLAGPQVALAASIAERIRAMVESSGRSTGGLGMTVSIGMAVSRTGRLGVDELLLAADRALYRAKDGGRNRIEDAQNSAVHADMPTPSFKAG